MGLMDRMMDRMIGHMSVQEKEDMMLKMMPIMMKDVDMLKMTPGMISGIGQLLNVTGIVVFVRKILKDEELKGELAKLADHLPQIGRKMQSVMADIRPALSTLISGMVGVISEKVMPVMMPMASEMMPAMMGSKMPEVMVHNDTAKEYMPGIMKEVFPHCIQTFSFMMASEERNEFFTLLTNSIDSAKD